MLPVAKQGCSGLIPWQAVLRNRYPWPLIHRPGRLPYLMADLGRLVAFLCKLFRIISHVNSVLCCQQAVITLQCRRNTVLEQEVVGMPGSCQGQFSDIQLYFPLPEIIKRCPQRHAV